MIFLSNVERAVVKRLHCSLIWASCCSFCTLYTCKVPAKVRRSLNAWRMQIRHFVCVQRVELGHWQLQQAGCCFLISSLWLSFTFTGILYGLFFSWLNCVPWDTLDSSGMNKEGNQPFNMLHVFHNECTGDYMEITPKKRLNNL